MSRAGRRYVQNKLRSLNQLKKELDTTFYKSRLVQTLAADVPEEHWSTFSATILLEYMPAHLRDYKAAQQAEEQRRQFEQEFLVTPSELYAVRWFNVDFRTVPSRLRVHTPRTATRVRFR